jgi:hypothetical protein
MHESARLAMRGYSFAHPTCTRCSCIGLSSYGDIARYERSLIRAVTVRFAIDFQLLLIKVFIRACSNIPSLDT